MTLRPEASRSNIVQLYAAEPLFDEVSQIWRFGALGVGSPGASFTPKCDHRIDLRRTLGGNPCRDQGDQHQKNCRPSKRRRIGSRQTVQMRMYYPTQSEG